MALRGSLKSFQPSELLQYLSHSGKSGILRVHDDQDTKFLDFRNGQLFYAVHHRPLPKLSEVVVHRGVISPERVRTSNDTYNRWDDVVSRVLARRKLDSDRTLARRKFDSDGIPEEGDRRVERVSPPEKEAQLASFLLKQGRLSQQELNAALEPVAIPNNLLAEILRGAEVITAEEFDEFHGRSGSSDSLIDHLLECGRVSAEQIFSTVSRMSDESLAELLVHRRLLSRAEARHFLGQLNALRVTTVPNVRLGEYLVTTARVTQRQVEKALEEQVVKRNLLGNILVAQGHITDEEVTQAHRELEILRLDFGPVHSIHERLLEYHGVEHESFVEALAELKGTDRTLAEVLVASGNITQEEMRRAVKGLLLDELSDLLMWEAASFEFFDFFTLDDVFSSSELPTIHSNTFSVQSLLLNAHSALDELQSGDLERVTSKTVFVSTADPESGETVPGEKSNIFMSLDGHTSVREIRRVISGHCFSHLRLLAQLHAEGCIRRLTREEAFREGEKARRERKHAEAIALLEHALETPGDEPADSDVRGALQFARLLGRSQTLEKGLSGIRSALKACRESRAVQWLSSRVERFGWLKSARTALSRAAGFLSRRVLKTRLAFEDFLIKTGWARHFWTLKGYVIDPFRGLFQQARRIPTFYLGGVVFTLLLLLIFTVWEPGDSQTTGRHALAAGAVDAEVESRPELGSFVAGGPLEAPPAVNGQDLYLTSRDGTVRSMRFEPKAARDSAVDVLKVVWEQKVGEFGDILSRPVPVGDRIFLTNVRGLTFALSASGEILWKKKLGRTEAIAPRPLLDPESGLSGLVIVSRESAYVLAPEDGRILYRLETGNTITARPVGDAEDLFVGSRDNHIYKSSWRRGEHEWEHEESDDILELILLEDILVFATRAGRVGALDRLTGAERWKKTFPTNSFQGVQASENGKIRIDLGQGKLEILAADSGETVSTFSPHARLDLSSMNYHGKRLFFVDDFGFLAEFTFAGKLRWRSRKPVGHVTGWVEGEDFLLLTSREGRLAAYGLSGDEVVPESENEAATLEP